jgi:hypothetical protein
MPGEVEEFSVEDAKEGVEVRVLVEDGVGRMALLFAGACEVEELEREEDRAAHADAVISFEPMDDEDTGGKSLTIGIGMRWIRDSYTDLSLVPCNFYVDGTFSFTTNDGYHSVDVLGGSEAHAAVYMQRLLAPLEWFPAGPLRDAC